MSDTISVSEVHNDYDRVKCSYEFLRSSLLLFYTLLLFYYIFICQVEAWIVYNVEAGCWNIDPLSSAQGVDVPTTRLSNLD